MTADTVAVCKTLGDGRPELGTVSVRDPRGRLHRLGTTTVPVQGHGAALLGAMSLFWELEDRGGMAPSAEALIPRPVFSAS